MLPSSLWLRLGGALAVCLIPPGLYLLGQHDGRTDARKDCELTQAASLRRAIEQAAEIAHQDAEILTTHEARMEGIRVVYRSLKQEANRYALSYQTTHHDDPCSLDADGMRLWTAANAGTLPAALGPAAPNNAVPGFAAAQLGPTGGVAGEPHRGGTAVSVMPGAAPGLERVGAASPPHWGW